MIMNVTVTEEKKDNKHTLEGTPSAQPKTADQKSGALQKAGLKIKDWVLRSGSHGAIPTLKID
jgi:hypothetical protein